MFSLSLLFSFLMKNKQTKTKFSFHSNSLFDQERSSVVQVERNGNEGWPVKTADMHVDILGLATRSSFCPAKEICKGVSVVWGVTLGTKEEEGRKEEKNDRACEAIYRLHYPPTHTFLLLLISPPEPRFLTSLMNIA